MAISVYTDTDVFHVTIICYIYDDTYVYMCTYYIISLPEKTEAQIG